MFKKKTDIEAVKNIALCLLHIEPEESDFGKVILMHPVFSSAFVSYKGSIVDIMEDAGAKKAVTKEIEEKILKTEDIWDFLLIIRVPYHLVFLKYIEDFLSREDFSRLLAEIWVLSENPNGDTNVTPDESAGLFRRADRDLMMGEEEKAYLAGLPETFTVYRGVSPGRVRNGLSWTANKEKAEWFKKRFNTEKEKGILLSGTVNKKDVLAYLNSRDEDELVIDPKNIRNKKEI